MWGDIEGSANRWPLAMYEEWPELRHHTKFHRQWITLIREHAQIVVDDAFLFDLYERHCFIGTERHAPVTIQTQRFGSHFQHCMKWLHRE